MIGAAETAQVLTQALPYVYRFAGKAVVVKLGGAAIDQALDKALAQDVLLLRSVGVRCVLVHGGGPQVDALMRRVGKEPEFRDGLRVTDEETLELVRMVLVGKINRDLVGTINREAVEEPVAVGVSGEDGGLLTVTARDPALGFVGDVSRVRPSVLDRLLDDGLTPVVATVGADKAGQPHNVNADEAARARVLAEVGALLPGDAAVVPAGETQSTVEEMTRAFQVVFGDSPTLYRREDRVAELRFQNEVRDPIGRKLSALGFKTNLHDMSSPWVGMNLLSVDPEKRRLSLSLSAATVAARVRPRKPGSNRPAPAPRSPTPSSTRKAASSRTSTAAWPRTTMSSVYSSTSMGCLPAGLRCTRFARSS